MDPDMHVLSGNVGLTNDPWGLDASGRSLEHWDEKRCVRGRPRKGQSTSSSSHHQAPGTDPPTKRCPCPRGCSTSSPPGSEELCPDCCPLPEDLCQCRAPGCCAQR